MSDKLGISPNFFIGVIEDRNDPLQLGRMRVRCIGYHTEILCNDTGSGSDTGISTGNEYCIDTEQLPWASVIAPSTSGAMNGIGISPPSYVEGTWVVGIFMDGDSAQIPMILGAIPGIPECVNELGNPEKKRDECDYLSVRSEGFYDPRKSSDLENAPRPPKRLEPFVSCQQNESLNDTANKNSFAGPNNESHNPAQQASSDPDLAAGVGEVGICIEENDGGENYPLEGRLEQAYRKGTFLLEPDTNRLAQTKDSDDEEEAKIAKTHIQWKRDNVDTEIDTAELPDISSKIPVKCGFKIGPGLANKLSQSDSGDVVSGPGQWNEPESPYDAQYPYNKVRESESGHLEEWDDTPGAERLHRMHRTGTAEEIFPDGTKVTKVVGENYEIVYINNKLHVKANCDVTVDKAYKLYVNRDGKDGNHLDIHVGPNSNFNLYAESDINLYAKEDLNLVTDTDLKINVGRDIIWNVAGDWEEHIGGTKDVTVVGNNDVSVGGNHTELISGSFLQEIQGGAKTQRISGEFYSISGSSTTMIGLPHIYLNPLSRPGSVTFNIDPTASCTE